MVGKCCSPRFRPVESAGCQRRQQRSSECDTIRSRCRIFGTRLGRAASDGRSVAPLNLADTEGRRQVQDRSYQGARLFWARANSSRCLADQWSRHSSRIDGIF